MKHLSPSAKFTLASTGFGFIAGLFATGYGIIGLGRNALKYMTANDKEKAKRDMTRSATTAMYGLIACTLSGAAYYNIAQGVGKTLDTHEPILGTIRTIRNKLDI